MCNSTSGRGFTLLELLVAAAVIALLTAALLPTLALIRESSRSLGCLNHLRQIGLGSMAYASDHRGMAVPSKIEWEMYSASANPTWTGSWNRQWMEQLWEYLPKNGDAATSREIYTCPQARLERVATQWPSTYGANGSVHPFNSCLLYTSDAADDM
jgi:prepilin-type N-terminal cleavage/methylation domain-containing protein